MKITEVRSGRRVRHRNPSSEHRAVGIVTRVLATRDECHVRWLWADDGKPGDKELFVGLGELEVV